MYLTSGYRCILSHTKMESSRFNSEIQIENSGYYSGSVYTIHFAINQISPQIHRVNPLCNITPSKIFKWNWFYIRPPLVATVVYFLHFIFLLLTLILSFYLLTNGTHWLTHTNFEVAPVVIFEKKRVGTLLSKFETRNMDRHVIYSDRMFLYFSPFLVFTG